VKPGLISILACVVFLLVFESDIPYVVCGDPDGQTPSHVILCSHQSSPILWLEAVALDSCVSMGQ